MSKCEGLTADMCSICDCSIAHKPQFFLPDWDIRLAACFPSSHSLPSAETGVVQTSSGLVNPTAPASSLAITEASAHSSRASYVAVVSRVTLGERACKSKIMRVTVGQRTI